MDEEKLKLAYDSIVDTNNLVDISKAHGKDFLMEDREDYNVMLTYSFPCQDLSLAGELAGDSIVVDVLMAIFAKMIGKEES